MEQQKDGGSSFNSFNEEPQKESRAVVLVRIVIATVLILIGLSAIL